MRDMKSTVKTWCKKWATLGMVRVCTRLRDMTTRSISRKVCLRCSVRRTGRASPPESAAPRAAKHFSYSLSFLSSSVRKRYPKPNSPWLQTGCLLALRVRSASSQAPLPHKALERTRIRHVTQLRRSPTRPIAR